MADFFERIPQEDYNLIGELIKAAMWYPTGRFADSVRDKQYEDVLKREKKMSRVQRERERAEGTKTPDWENDRERMLMELQLAKRPPDLGGGAVPEMAPSHISDMPPMPGMGMMPSHVGGMPTGPSMDMVPSHGPYQAPPPVDDMYVPQRAKLPEEMDADRHAQNWADFLKLNPNLDLEAVARQSGGNVQGGTFSEMPENNFPAGHPQSDEAFFRWVDDFVLQQKLDEVQDPNNRKFNPRAAEQLIEAAKLRELQRQQQYLQEITRRSMSGERALTPDEALAMSQSGVPYGVIDMIAGAGRQEQPRGPSVNPAQLMSVIESLQDTVNEGEDAVQKKAELDLARYMIANGRIDEANAIIGKYLPRMQAEQPQGAIRPAGNDIRRQQLNSVLGLE
jgi:hypothetical protein